MSTSAMRLPANAAHAHLMPWALLLLGMTTLYGPSLADALRGATVTVCARDVPGACGSTVAP